MDANRNDPKYADAILKLPLRAAAVWYILLSVLELCRQGKESRHAGFA